jgi:EcsC protein family
MLVGAREIRCVRKTSFSGKVTRRLLRFGALRSLRSIEVDPEAFRRELADKHAVWVPNFERMSDVPIERLDAIAAKLIRSAGQLALAEGVGFGFGGMLTLVPDTSLLVVITLRLIQRLSLLYGLPVHDPDQRLEMWKATAAAAGVDYGKDVAEKQIFERLAPRIAKTLATKMGAEAAEKWAGRLIPLASSAVGGALNYTFVRAWGRRVQRHLRAQHLIRRPVSAALQGQASAETSFVQ